MKRIIATAVFAAFAGSALAHDEKYDTPKKAGYAKAEETAFGRAADPKKAKRTVKVEMSDQMRFSPAEITVRRGETVRFVPVNRGQVMHEMVLGTLDDLKKHAELMKKFPEMEHDQPHMAHVAPGKTGEMGWQFTKAGEFYYGCLLSGHFEAGMVGKVIVLAQATPAFSEGEIRKVDKEARKITIKHGPIENLDMPAMTMVFQVKDPAMLDRVKAGDKVRFKADKIGGAFTLMEIKSW